MLALVVDDEPDVADLLAHHLMALDFTVSIVGSGEAALALSPDGPWDLAVVDLILPGMGGAELIRRLQESSPGHVPVIATSVLGRLELGRVDADAVLPKPFRGAEVGRAVRHAREALR